LPASFDVSGMAGGAAADCDAGAGCTSDFDCLSGTCGMSTPGICD
jgi:hypothetical protein